MCSGVTPSGRKIYAITQFQSCLFQNVPWRERLAMSTGNFRKSGRWNIFLSSTGAPLRVSYAQRKFRCIRNTTTDVITQLDMLRCILNNREMRERPGSPILKNVYWGNKIYSKKQAKRMKQQSMLATWWVRWLLGLESHSKKVSSLKSACYLLQVKSIQKRRVSLATSAFQLTQWQSAFLTCQKTYMINCVRKPNVFVHTQSLLIRARTTLGMHRWTGHRSEPDGFCL